MTELKINGKTFDVSVPADTPLLWVLRDEIGLTGTKFGCGIAACGLRRLHCAFERRRHPVLCNAAQLGGNR